VVGVGNVAVDVARILCRTPDELATTDLADHALDALSESRVKEVYLLGRRGPAQAAFTTPEVKELGELAAADAITLEDEVALDPLSAAEVERENEATTKRKLEIVQELSRRAPSGKARRLTIRFLVSPIELIDDGTGRVNAIRLMRNRLVERNGSLAAEPTGVTEDLPVDLVFRSVGYHGVAIDGLPFDRRTGTVPNVAGRVIDPATTTPIPGLYVAGWIKRGPSGVIGTNKPDAGETAEAILADFAAGSLRDPVPSATEAVDALVRSRQPDVVTWADWLTLNQAETALGKPGGRPRRKLSTTRDMLETIRKGRA